MMFTAGRVTAVAIGLPLVLGSAAWGAFTMVGLFAHTSEHHSASYAWRGGAISVTATSGSVHVVAGTGQQIGVSYTEHYSLKRPTVVADKSGRGLQLTARCPGGIFSNNCAVNYVLTVPKAARLVLHTGDGDVGLTGTSGPASIDTGDGGVSLDRVSGAITARSGDGGVSGVDVRSATVSVSTGDGGIEMRWTLAPTTVLATSGDGSISLAVPAGSGPYRTSGASGDGRVSITVRSDPHARASITARSGDGGINIAAAG